MGDDSNANSAIVVTVTPEDFGSAHPLAGIAFQRRLEQAAFSAGGGKIRKPSGPPAAHRCPSLHVPAVELLSVMPFDVYLHREYF